MNFIESTGKTVEMAINSALSELNTTRDCVEVEVLEEGTKGFLNLFGNKEAKVRVTLNRIAKNEVERYLKNLFELMHISVDFNVNQDGDRIKVDIDGNNLGVLIGNKGDTLDSIQLLTNLAINKDKSNKYVRVDLDIGGYKAKREEVLISIANKNVEKVIETGKRVILKPMNAYERRIVHAALQSNEEIETYSEGKEPFRKIIIQKKKV